MKVKDLINKLQELPEDAELVIYHHDDILEHYCEYRPDIDVTETEVFESRGTLVPSWSSLVKKDSPKKTVYVLE